MQTPSSPAAGTDLKGAWRALVEQIKAGEAPLGRRLYLLGAGPVPVEGAAGGALTLVHDGGVVLVVGLAEVAPSVAGQIARQLDALAALPGAKLREAGVDPREGGGLAARHARFFDLGGAVADLNALQSCIVVLAAAPTDEERAALADALGDRLAGIFRTTDAGVEAVDAAPAEAEAEPELVVEPEVPEAAPEAALPEAEAEPAEGAAEAPPEADVTAPVEAEAEAPTEEAEPPAPVEADALAATDVALDEAAEVAEEDPTVVIAEEPALPLEDQELAEEPAVPLARPGWPVGNWIGLSMVVVGVVLAVIGVMNLNAGDDRAEQPAEDPNPTIRTVARDVVADATHARWIGQQRVVALSDGTLVFAYPDGESLNLVKDEANSGDTWLEPFVLDEIAPVSLSIDVDSKDRIHVAYSDGASIAYVRLKDKPSGWKPSRVIQLDETTNAAVDVAWDEQNQTAHVVWAQQSDEGEAPAWAALTSEGGIHLTEQGILADAAREVPVLVSVAADGRSSLLVTYRHGDQIEGWSSRYSPGRDADGTWLFNEEDLVPVPGFVGAADVLYDRQKTAHLVVRDSTNYEVLYLTKRIDEPWSQAEVAVTGPDEKAMDFPTLSYNAAEGNLYLFFQTNEHDPAGEIAYSVRALGDGAGAWQGPFEIMTPADAPEGALYPVTPDRVDEQSIVFWTETGEVYEVGSAPVGAPE